MSHVTCHMSQFKFFDNWGAKTNQFIMLLVEQPWYFIIQGKKLIMRTHESY